MLALSSILLILALAAQRSRAHGYLAIPVSRNYLHNSDSCPQCWNAGGIRQTRGSEPFPNSMHGMCGDPAVGPLSHEAGGPYANGTALRGTFAQGSQINIAFDVAAYHKGKVQYRICRFPAGLSPDAERAALTNSCLDEHILTQANITGAQLANSSWQYLGNASDQGFDPPRAFHATFQLPQSLACDGVTAKCVMQAHWVTGNSCNPTGTPRQFQLRYLAPCGGGETNWPEEFWNCADIRILPRGSPGIDPIDPSAPAFSPALFQGPAEWEDPANDEETARAASAPSPPQSATAQAGAGVQEEQLGNPFTAAAAAVSGARGNFMALFSPPPPSSSLAAIRGLPLPASPSSWTYF